MEYYIEDSADARLNRITVLGGSGHVGYNSVISVTFVEGSSAPAEPVTLEEFKDQFGKIDVSEEDEMIENDLIPAARQLCEAYTNLSFIERQVIAVINNSNGGFFLPYGPVTNTPTAADKDDNALTIAYEFGRIESPTGRMTVTYNAGYSTLPERLKLGLLNAIYYLYENRSVASDDIGEVAKRILKPFRRV